MSPAPELKATLTLPQTAFPMKANLPQNEPLRLKRWGAMDLYARLREACQGRPPYILHDGPPYANGPIHLGHALNKGLKDFVVKSKTMAGFDAPYVPGYDCHGLPIEIKVDEQLGRKKLEMPAPAVLAACRAYAQKYVDLQTAQFERIGCFGRWQKPYKTMARDYEARTLEVFYAFLEKGFVYRGLKPVYWCTHDRTALAEAEVEYAMHTSPSIYVRYRLTSDPATIDPALKGKQVSTIIWTTTPWTLPASMAVAFHPDFDYVALQTNSEPPPSQTPRAPSFPLLSAERVGDHQPQQTGDPDSPKSGDLEGSSESESKDPRSSGEVYIVAAELAEHVAGACHLGPTTELARFKGSQLDRVTFQHPFLNRSILGVLANYVTADTGTGAVHTAPSHGMDDFFTGQRYGIDANTRVDASGRISVDKAAWPHAELPPFEGLTVWKANPIIVEMLKTNGSLLGHSQLEHSYPHCWRCHNPVIFRATEQWFISLETPMPRADGTETTYRQLTIEEIDKVIWDPAWGKERITNMIATRPDWCISRQRIWGVPIAVFLCEGCNKPILDPALNRATIELFDNEGAEAWHTSKADALLPANATCVHCGGKKFRRETDILDVWFDSGVSWFAVCESDPDLRAPYAAFQSRTASAEAAGNGPLSQGTTEAFYQSTTGPLSQGTTRALSQGTTSVVPKETENKEGALAPATPPEVLYLEGGDQHRGWFHSSLLTSVALRGIAPYSHCATVGWTLDEKGRAMSKSLGNGVDPVDIAERLGGEIVRLWVASIDFREDMAASEDLMQRCADIYRKLRNTFRFLLGNLHGFVPARDQVSEAELLPLDRYMLARTRELTEKIRDWYAAFDFHRVYHAVNEFAIVDLSSFYLDVLKDRMYTFAPTSKARRSAQTVLWKITEALARLVAPILSFTAEEVWDYLPPVEGREASVHLALFPSPEEIFSQDPSRLDERWNVEKFEKRLLPIRNVVLKAIETERKLGNIGKSLEARVKILASAEDAALLEFFGPEMLQEFFNVSEVDVQASSGTGTEIEYGEPAPCTAIASVVLGTKCNRCLRYTRDTAAYGIWQNVCDRCHGALKEMGIAPPQAAPPQANGEAA